MSVVDILSDLEGLAPVIELFFADSPVFLIDGTSTDVVIANPVAASFVRAGQLSALSNGSVRLRGPANARLGELAMLDDLSNTPRIEMLRFFVGARAVTLPFMCQRLPAPAPQPNVLAIAAAPPASELSARDKAAIAFDDDPRAVALFDADGAMIYANTMAHETGIATMAELSGNDALTRFDFEDGELVLFAAPANGALERAQVVEPTPSIDDLPPRQQRGMTSIGGMASTLVEGLGGPAAGSGSARTILSAVREAKASSEAEAQHTAETALPKAGTRFRFTLDAEARITDAAPALDEIGLAGHVGDSLDDLLTGDLSALVEAIELRDTFNSVHVAWRISGTGAPARVEIAGLPLLDGRGGYEGLRGFSVVGERMLDLIDQAPDVAPADDASNEEVQRSEPAHQAETDTVTSPGIESGLAAGAVALGAGAMVRDDETDADDAAIEEPESQRVRKPRESASSLDPADWKAFAEIAERLNGAPRDSSDSDFDTIDDVMTDTAPVEGTRTRVEEARDADLFSDRETPRTPAPAAGHHDDTSRHDDAHVAPEDTTPAPAIERQPDDFPGQSDHDDSDRDDVNIVHAVPVDAGQRRLSRGRARDANDFVALIDRLPFGLMFLRDEKPLYANRAMLDLFGYTDLDDLEIAGGLHALFESLQNTREPGKRMLAGVTRDGMPIELDARLQLAPWIDGPALLLSARERLTADDDHIAELEAEVVELKDILDTATDGIVLLDNEGSILSLNRAAEALFGRDSREARGDSFAELFSQSDRATVSTYLDSLQDNGVASVLNDGREISGLEKNGGAMPLFLTIGRVGFGDRQKFCAVLRDIAQWKRSESELVAARREAEQTASQKSDVLAKVSHEVRTPLNAIIGFADVMLAEQFGPIGNDRYRDYLGDIKNSGEHIISLVNDLLDLSKVEAGMMDMDFAQVKLNDVVEQCVAIMQGQANREQVILRTSSAPNLPDIVADIRSIRQILLNLLSNAVKFTPPAGQIIVSTVYTELGEVLLRVRDTGHGMSQDDIESALEPYRQTPSSALEKTGTGIGLPLTKALTEANRATFSIESRIDNGTLVQITFPSTRVLAE